MKEGERPLDIFKLFGKIIIGGADEAEDTIGRITGVAKKAGTALLEVGKVAGTALVAAGTAVAAISKVSLDAYANYEQLVGGVETLFKDSSDIVQQYAQQAYQTAGMSANAYMETVTSFSASLLQGLGGDTAKAAEYADMAIRDMSDNANKMGTNIGMIQNAYQGFAKQNYTMLDNLKLGYGGTQQEMERLLKDANRINKENGKMTNYSIKNLNDVYEAIHVVQEEMGIYGTTLDEASETISGSLSAAKAAWENLLVGFADGNQDLGLLINNFVGSVTTAANNIVPRLAQILGGLSAALAQVLPVISAELPVLLEQLLPGLISGATSLITGLAMALPTICQILIAELPGIISQLSAGLVSVFPVLLDTVKWLFAQVWDHIAVKLLGTEADFKTTFTKVSKVCTDVFNEIKEKVTEVKNIFAARWKEIVSSAEDAWEAIVTAFSPIADVLGGLFNLAKLAIQIIWDSVPAYFDSIITTITGIFSVVASVLSGDFQAAWDAIQEIVDTWEAYFARIWDSIKSVFDDATDVGSQIIADIQEGISNAWEGLKRWFKNLWDGLFGNLTADVTVNGNNGGTDGSHASGLDYVPFDGYIAELHRGEMVVPAAEARILRSGASGAVANTEIANILMMILDAVQEGNDRDYVFKMNNREFGRAVRGVVNA